MIRISQFAAPVVLGLSLSIGLAGCANHERQVIPSDAVILQQGRHMITASANHPGTVYVYDNSDNKLLYSGPVSKGDAVTVNPTKDTISVNNKTVSQQPLDDVHHYRIYEEEGQSANEGSVIGQTNATEQNNVGPTAIPNGAVILQEGRHTVSAAAAHPGTVYVYDDSDQKLLYTGPVSKGDAVIVDPTANSITVNGRTVSQQSLDNTHQYRIYEEEQGNGQSTVIRQEGSSTEVQEPQGKTTVITKPNSTVIHHNNGDNGEGQ